MPKKAAAPPSPFVQSLTDVLRDAQDGRLLRPRISRGFVWSQDMVVRLWTSLAAGLPIGALVVRTEAEGAVLEPMSVDEGGALAASPLAAGERASGIYDGFNRVAALSMSAYGQSVRAGHSHERRAWRVAYDAVVGTFHGGLRRPRAHEVTMLPDISALFCAPNGAALTAVVDTHLTRMRSVTSRQSREALSSFHTTVAERNLYRLSELLDRSDIPVIPMRDTATDDDALAAMFDANGIVRVHQAPSAGRATAGVLHGHGSRSTVHADAPVVASATCNGTPRAERPRARRTSVEHVPRYLNWGGPARRHSRSHRACDRPMIPPRAVRLGATIPPIARPDRRRAGVQGRRDSQAGFTEHVSLTPESPTSTPPRATLARDRICPRERTPPAPQHDVNERDVPSTCAIRDPSQPKGQGTQHRHAGDATEVRRNAIVTRERLGVLPQDDDIATAATPRETGRAAVLTA